MSGMEMIGMLAAGASAIGSIAGGLAQKQASDFEAQQLQREATQQQAVGQRRAAATTEEKNRLISSQRAAGAASGYGGATDVSTLQNIGAVESEGTLRAMQDVYAGNDAARGLQNKAAAAKAEGRNAMTAGLIGGIAQGAKGWAEVYG